MRELNWERRHDTKAGRYREQKRLQREWFEQDAKRLGGKYRSSMHYLLAALVPYTESNLKLSFSPYHFFGDLTKLDYARQKKKLSKDGLRAAYYRAVKSGLISVEDGLPRLTVKGRRKLNYFQPQKLGPRARLLLVFDVPESERHRRDKFRLILKEFYFQQIQKSVWETKYDCQELLEAAINEEGLGQYVRIYEAVPV